jgi:hypothetical protein
MAGKTFQRGGRSDCFFCVVVLVPPPALEVTGDIDKEEKSRREERLRPWGGAYGMRRQDRRVTA